MDTQDGTQQSQQLILAHNVFLLKHPDVSDIEKVRLSDEVLNSVQSNDMTSYYETLVTDKVLELDQSLLESMRAKNEEEIKKLDEKIADAEENLGESEVREAHLTKSLYYIRIGEKEKALEQLKVTESKRCFHFCLNGARLPRALRSSHVNSYSNFSTVQSSADSAMAALNSIRVAAVQMTSVNDLSSNFSTCSRLVKEAASAGAKMICFPESFSFLGPKSEDSLLVAEALDGPIMQKYCSLAREYSIWLSLGGFQEKGHDAHLRNTHVIVDDAGNIRSTYSKIHLFDVDVPGGSTYRESSFTEPGKDIAAVDSPIGRLGLTICYDLRFPEIYQQLRFNHDAQVILVPSAFTPVTGQAHWEILLRARAIETQCYVIASAQAGKHNEKRESYGDTLIIDPWGTVVGRLPDRLSTGITVADIDLSLIDSVRKKMPIAEVNS